jgi:hypothetical protein
MSKALKRENTSILDTHVFTGYQGSVPYLKPKKGAVDNTGRHHVYTELVMYATKNFY